MAVKMMRDRSIFLYRDKAGKSHFRAEVVADTAAELTGADVIENIVLEMGSAALVVNKSSVYVLNSEGVWKEQGV